MPLGTSEYGADWSPKFCRRKYELALEVCTDSDLVIKFAKVINLTFVTRESLLSSVRGI